MRCIVMLEEFMRLKNWFNGNKAVLGLKNLEIPAHIAIIPDGNGRWAQKRGLPRSAGHKAGSENLKNIVKFCNKIGVKYLTAYVFSTENWSRPQSEVDTLMNMLFEYLQNAEKELEGTGIRIKVIGKPDGLPEKLRDEIPRVEKLTAENTGLTLIFALNYGSRDEIVRAVRGIVRSVLDGETDEKDIDENTLSRHLYTHGIPDPDIVIRTSGEMRSSNFLLWQSAYSEYWFCKVLWPDFRERHLMDAIYDFNNRSRRYGGV
jgi:undecaprenyl diphosphate synthase